MGVNYNNYAGTAVGTSPAGQRILGSWQDPASQHGFDFNTYLDESGRPFNYLGGRAGGQRVFNSPSVYGGDFGSEADPGGFWHMPSGWDQNAGEVTHDLNWQNIGALAVGGIAGAAAAPAILGAAGGGSAASGGAAAGAGTSGTAATGGILPSTLLGSGAAGAVPSGLVAGGTGLTGAAAGGATAGAGSHLASSILGNTMTDKILTGSQLVGGAISGYQAGKRADAANQINRDQLDLAAPQRHLSTSFNASKVANWTPETASWGAPGSGPHGSRTFSFQGGYQNPNLVSPETRQLAQQIVRQQLQKQMNGGY